MGQAEDDLAILALYDLRVTVKPKHDQITVHLP